MNWVKAGPALIAVASAMIVVAMAPPILVDPLVTAVAQIRQSTTRTAPSVVTPLSMEEIPYPEETPVPKKSKK